MTPIHRIEWLVAISPIASHRALRVATVLASHASSGAAWPSRDRIALIAGVSPRTVSRAVHDLGAIGAVRSTKKGAYLNNYYELQWPTETGKRLQTEGI